jgi:hypothetical protein
LRLGAAFFAVFFFATFFDFDFSIFFFLAGAAFFFFAFADFFFAFDFFAMIDLPILTAIPNPCGPAVPADEALRWPNRSTRPYGQLEGSYPPRFA